MVLSSFFVFLFFLGGGVGVEVVYILVIGEGRIYDITSVQANVSVSIITEINVQALIVAEHEHYNLNKC